MIDDFQTFSDNQELVVDVCVIGAGAAGITLARELADGSHSVLVLESGGLDFEQETQDLYQGDIVGRPYEDLDVSRLRYFGGTTNHWGGHSLPMHEIDFQTRPWIPYSGWPITRAELDPYYRKAAKICGLNDFSFGEQRWRAIGATVPAFDQEKMTAIMQQIATPVRFGEAYREELRHAENTRVLLHANVVEIAADASATTIDHVKIQTLGGKQGKIRARIFVLACGGIENVRILLNSTGVEPHGLGNRHGLVGRFFMDHGNWDSAGEIMTDQPRLLVNLFMERAYNGVDNNPFFKLTDRFQKNERILNVAWRVNKSSEWHAGVVSAREIWRSLKHEGRWPDGLGEKVWGVATDLDVVGLDGYRKLAQRRESVPIRQRFYLTCSAEPAPNPDSRVLLAKERDALGMRQVILDWRLTEMDRHTLLVTLKTAAGELARNGLGRVRIANWLLQKSLDWPATDVYRHHTGTTRMATDPKHGVVQADCRVHGIDNLYIAGSSVFPTAGHTGTTITIVALALRLVEHLKKRLG